MRLYYFKGIIYEDFFFFGQNLLHKSRERCSNCFFYPFDYILVIIFSVMCDYPGQNMGMGSLSLLQGIFPTQGLNPGLLHCGQTLYQLSHKRSPRILDWVAYPFSRASFWPRNWTRVSCIAGGFFTSWAIRKPRYNQQHVYMKKLKNKTELCYLQFLQSFLIMIALELSCSRLGIFLLWKCKDNQVYGSTEALFYLQMTEKILWSFFPVGMILCFAQKGIFCVLFLLSIEAE